MFRTATLMMVALSSVLCGAAQAKSGKCLLEVDNRPLLLGTCNIDMQADGSFSVGTSGSTSSTHFAFVQVNQNGSALGYWNGEERESHAHEPLGALKRQGACWTNDKAKVCAWR
jgi:hypothetical protein